MGTNAANVGRPSSYDPLVAAAICEGLAQGMSLRTVMKSEGMPHLSSVFLWLAKYPEFSDQYAKAKQNGVEALAEDLIEIADNGTNDWMERNDPENPGYRVNGEHINRSRLRVETRKWVMSKLAPKKYGEHGVVALTGADGGAIQVETDHDEFTRRVALMILGAQAGAGAIDVTPSAGGAAGGAENEAEGPSDDAGTEP